MVRLGRIWKPSALVIQKAMTERAMSYAAIPCLSEDSLPPVEVLGCPGA